MDGDALHAILDAVKEPHKIGDVLARPKDWVFEDPNSVIVPEPAAQALAVTTLGAVRDYLKANKDGLSVAQLQVHVVSPTVVHLFGPLSARARRRETYLTANAGDLTDGFLGKFMALTDFILGLQVRFADADNRHKLLSLLSTVKHETVKSAMDDGMTQVVQARAGVALIADVPVPNPVLLTGLRAFRDIVQPSSLYVLRVQPGPQGGLPQVALFEADGGAWKLGTLERVREWLIEQLPADVAILA